jgi:hypothetical protein
MPDDAALSPDRPVIGAADNLMSVEAELPRRATILYIAPNRMPDWGIDAPDNP